MVINPSGGLSEGEVSSLVQEARGWETEEKGKKDRDTLVRQLDGLVANAVRSIQALEAKLTSEERQEILDAIEEANKAKTGGSLDDLRSRLADLERAVTVIGQAMLRPCWDRLTPLEQEGVVQSIAKARGHWTHGREARSVSMT
jgi:molecular chaperone DnaK